MCVDVVDSKVVVGMKEVVVVGRSVVCPWPRAKTVKASYQIKSSTSSKWDHNELKVQLQ